MSQNYGVPAKEIRGVDLCAVYSNGPAIIYAGASIVFHKLRHPGEMAEPEINAFLTHLAVKEKVSASTQNLWTTCKGETKVSYTETTYHTIPSLVSDLTTSIYNYYVNLREGVLCSDFAVQRCYEETI